VASSALLPSSCCAPVEGASPICACFSAAGNPAGDLDAFWKKLDELPEDEVDE
jgi:hypothetical protein